MILTTSITLKWFDIYPHLKSHLIFKDINVNVKSILSKLKLKANNKLNGRDFVLTAKTKE